MIERRSRYPGAVSPRGATPLPLATSPVFLGALTALFSLSAPVQADEPTSTQGESVSASADSSSPIDVRIEGDRGPPRGARDPVVTSYVARGEALRRPGATAAEVIAASPGVQIARSGAGSDLSTVSIRGAPSASLPVYLAGVRLNDDVTGTADVSTVPLMALDRIEVYRGNAPSDADRLGIAGALFFEPKLPRGTKAWASLGAGSFGELSLSAAGSIGAERAAALFAFSRQSADNNFTFDDDRLTADPADDRRVQRVNGDATTYDAWTLGRIELSGGGRLVLLANAFAREQGVSGTTFLPARSARSATSRELAALSARLPCSLAEGSGAADRCSLEVSASGVIASREIADPDRELGFLATRALVSGERWEQSVRLRAFWGDKWRFGGALYTGIDRLQVDLSGGERTRASRLSITGSLNTTWSATERLELSALLGGECHSAFGAADSAACGAGGPSGRVGARLLGPYGIDAIASLGSYLRVPTLGEQYGLSGTVLGNKDLVAERGYSGEVGLRWGGAQGPARLLGYLEVTGFVRHAENLIAYRLTGPGTIKPFNVAQARTMGAELLAGLSLSDIAVLEQSLTVLDPRDVTPGRRSTYDQLPYQATVTSSTRLELAVTLATLRPVVDRAGLAASFRYRSARAADRDGLRYLAEQRDLGLDLTVSLFRRRLFLRASATNLLDLINQDLLGFPLPSRAFHGAVEGTW